MWRFYEFWVFSCQKGSENGTIEAPIISAVVCDIAVGRVLGLFVVGSFDEAKREEMST
jgi:hypothetical protein